MIASPTISYPNEEENEQVDNNNNNNNKETAYFFQTCLGNQPNNKNPYLLFL